MKDIKHSYWLPLLIYFISGASSITSISSSFFVKDYLSITAAGLATLGFWTTLPWALKIPFGQLVDKFYHRKHLFVFIGSLLISTSFLIIIGILTKNTLLLSIANPNTLFVFSSLIAPIGWVLQDVVADATTAEVVPNEIDGVQRDIKEIHQEHIKVQTLSRISVMLGIICSSIFNIILFNNTQSLTIAEKNQLFTLAYLAALALPISITILLIFLKSNNQSQRTIEPINKIVLIGAISYALISISLGLTDFKYSTEVSIFFGITILSYLAYNQSFTIPKNFRTTLLATAFLLFMFRATPSTGEGMGWWMIDILKFDPEFYSNLSLISSVMAVLGLYLLKDKIAKASLIQTVLFLTAAGVILSLPVFLMYFYDIHNTLSVYTNGLINAKTLMFIDTAIASPLDHIAMIPVLAWIAASSPQNNKATWFALMSSIANLALQASNVITSHINQIYIVTRESKDTITGIITKADYSQLGTIMIVVTMISIIMPVLGVVVFKTLEKRNS